MVLYFYPAAFAPGCTVQAHEFAEATDKFKALGATVIGVSHDALAILQKRQQQALLAAGDERSAGGKQAWNIDHL